MNIIKTHTLSILYCSLCVLLFGFSPLNSTYAASNIDTAEKYAWGEDSGWFNFNPANGDVTVTDTAITGHIWSENYGWINLQPNNGGVQNNCGDLSGYAWGENVGWIDFSEAKIDVVGSETGEFTGTLTGDNIGTIHLTGGAGSSIGVKTDWICDLIHIGFEGPDLLSNKLNSSGLVAGMVTNPAPVFEGSQSMEVLIDRDNAPFQDSNNRNFRKEVTLQGEGMPFNLTKLEYDEDYWFGFATYLDPNWVRPELSDIIFQIHGTPDGNIFPGEPAETWRNPMLALSYLGLQGSSAALCPNSPTDPGWGIGILGDPRPNSMITGDPYPYPTDIKGCASSAVGDTGRWITWVIHYRPSFTDNGKVQIWKDGISVYDSPANINTAFNDNVGPYIKIGSYKWSWRLKNEHQPRIDPAVRLHHVDSLRIAKGANRFNDVLPVPGN